MATKLLEELQFEINLLFEDEKNAIDAFTQPTYIFEALNIFDRNFHRLAFAFHLAHISEDVFNTDNQIQYLISL